MEVFCNIFAHTGPKWGAKLNTEKMSILMSTNGTDVPRELLKSSRIGRKLVGKSLQNAIKTYLTKLAKKRVNGLRILGVPIGSQTIYQDFIMTQVAKMENDAMSLLSGLENFQTQLQL